MIDSNCKLLFTKQSWHWATRISKVSMKILMIDDHPLMCDAVASVLSTIDSRNTIQFADSLKAACQILTKSFDFDLVLLDLGLSDAQDMEGLKVIKARFPETTVVVMSADRQPSVILETLNLGAAGYIPKTSGKQVLVNALRLVASGSVYVPAEAIAHVDVQAVSGVAPRTSGAPIEFAQLGLTVRQSEVLKLILRGMPNKLICRQLDLAEGTVKVHVSAVLKSLGATNRTQAVVAASKLGLKII